MTFELIPNISLIVAVVGIFALIARRFPEAKTAVIEEKTPPKSFLQGKAILALELPTRVWARVGFWVRRTWHFLLEAKDLRKPAEVGYRIKKLLPHKRAHGAISATLDEIGPASKDEQYYLKRIQQSPKDLETYNALGKFYTDEKRFAEARDIYTYLVKREPGNAMYYARLAFASFRLELFAEAVQNYEKSLALDPAQPNRFYNLALSLEALGKKEEALVPIRKAVELEPQNKKYLELARALSIHAGISREVRERQL